MYLFLESAAIFAEPDRTLLVERFGSSDGPNEWRLPVGSLAVCCRQQWATCASATLIVLIDQSRLSGSKEQQPGCKPLFGLANQTVAEPLAETILAALINRLSTVDFGALNLITLAAVGYQLSASAASFSREKKVLNPLFVQ